MKAYRYALPLFLALAGAAAACSSDDDDDDTELNQGGSGGGQGAGGTSATQGAGGAAGTAGGGGGGSGGGTSQGGAGACGTPEAELAAAPATIKAIVDERRNLPRGGTAASIVRYDYNGVAVDGVNAVVYYVPPPPMTSDASSQLFAQSGTLICEPEGGFMGNGDGGCVDFAERRSNACVVWASGGPAQ